MQFQITLLSCLLALIVIGEAASLFSTELHEEWELYKVKHKRKYDASEEGARRFIWERNVRMISKHNLEADMGMHTYWMGVNKFTDWTVEEWNKMRHCYFKSNNSTANGVRSFRSKFNIALPDSVDWRDKGYVTEVKDQGSCGSCWAFSATGSLEGQNKAVSGNLVSLSEQNLIDCSFEEGNMGCDGGLMTSSFAYVYNNKGIDTEESYPYVGVVQDCRFNPSTVGATCKGYSVLPAGDESSLQAAVATVGPISIAIDASDNFMHYQNGVFYDPDCSATELDHGVLVVGYGTSNGADYWIVKNSWNSNWGMNGYILMSRNKNNNCGIASMASYPLM